MQQRYPPFGGCDGRGSRCATPISLTTFWSSETFNCRSLSLDPAMLLVCAHEHRQPPGRSREEGGTRMGNIGERTALIIGAAAVAGALGPAANAQVPATGAAAAAPPPT